MRGSSDGAALRLALLVMAALAVAACPLAPPGPCDCPRGGVCAEGPSNQPTCMQRCAARAECPTGFECRMVRPSGVDLAAPADDLAMNDGGGEPSAMACYPLCEQALCPAHFECVATQEPCQAVRCGRYTKCEEVGAFCDLATRDCFPADGACSVDSDCPVLVQDTRQVSELRCVEQRCRRLPRELQLPNAGGVPGVEVGLPAAGAEHPTEAEVRFEWRGAEEATLLLVLRDLPRYPTELLSLAVWGHALPAGAPPVARWSDGVAIKDGRWEAAPQPAPRDVPLYFLVQAVHRGELVALSAPRVFRVGGAWPKAGDACDAQATRSCASPAAPLYCRQGVCRTLCASFLDCATCSVTAEGLRVCALM